MTTTLTQQAVPDYGEPWQLESDDEIWSDNGDEGTLAVAYGSVRERIVDCVNACAGMADPAAEIKAMREELADIRQRLKGHPDSKLDGENGLAAATMRGFDKFDVENEAMRQAIKGAKAALEDWQLFFRECGGQLSSKGWEAGYQLRQPTTEALAKLQPFLKP